MSSFNEETRIVILANVRAGMGTERAALGAGVSRVTLWRWLRRGREERGEGRRTAYVRFLEAFEIAEANAVAQLETTLHEQAREDWRANAWLLSRKRPLEYAQEPIAEALRKQCVEELIDFLERRARPETFREVLELLANHADTETDTARLPCPG